MSYWNKIDLTFLKTGTGSPEVGGLQTESMWRLTRAYQYVYKLHGSDTFQNTVKDKRTMCSVSDDLAGGGFTEDLADPKRM